ncbi:hypothetical protein ACH5RR_013159 [Cinchona calisaya]|uniref:Uncharacterized protein n=1 Tax=Cinchona calisaya TaxID=153742 RepID=A0ABD2ZZD1_9GENT
MNIDFSGMETVKWVGNSDVCAISRRQRIIRRAKLSNLSSVTPKSLVTPAPIRPPRKLLPLEMDIRAAKSAATMASGHILAANTTTGVKEA